MDRRTINLEEFSELGFQRIIIGEKNCDKFCIEFGAGNGISSSNTYNLIRNKDYKALLIEPNKKAYKRLCTNIPSNDIIKINKNVTFSGENSLDKILDSHNINRSFDFLSIDIDGCDYFIFESLKNYKPKIICIEFNPTIPNEVIFIQKRDMNIKQASSARALVELANKKDYSLFSSTYCNLLFVSNELKEKVLGKKDNSLNAIRDDSYCKNYVFTGQDGTIFTSKKIILRNHFLELEVDDLQLLPKILLKYPGDYNFFQRILYKFFRIFYFLRYPRLFFKKINPMSNKKILKTFYKNIFKKDIW